jgi:hypothetical protein
MLYVGYSHTLLKENIPRGIFHYHKEQSQIGMILKLAFMKKFGEDKTKKHWS